MGTTLNATFETRREAEMTVERLVQEHGINRADIFITAAANENTVGEEQAGSDTEAGPPSPETRDDSPLNGAVTVSVDIEDERWMRRAIEVARSKGSDPASSPLGCVIVLDDREIAAERNQTHELPDATAHAEMMAIRRACKSTGVLELRGATLYSTLQPCGMCTMASIWSKVGRVVYGAGRDDVHPMYFETRHVDTLSFIGDAYRDDIVIEGGCLREECATLYYPPDAKLPQEEQANL